jgi:hypothetical protein
MWILITPAPETLFQNASYQRAEAHTDSTLALTLSSMVGFVTTCRCWYAEDPDGVDRVVNQMSERCRHLSARRIEEER